jgi:hypothetical protein
MHAALRVLELCSYQQHSKDNQQLPPGWYRPQVRYVGHIIVFYPVSQGSKAHSSLSYDLVAMAGAVSGLYSCARADVVKVQLATITRG